jgi:hypothetical protein
MRKHRYSQKLFQYFDYFLNLTFSIGALTFNHYFSPSECLNFESIRKKRNKKVLIDGEIFLINPWVRLIQTSKFLIFKDMFTNQKLKLEIQSPDIISNIRKNKEKIIHEKMGFFLSH